MNKKKSKPTCIFLIKRNGKPYRYMVRVTVNSERKYVGCFETLEAATEALEKATTPPPARKTRRELIDEL